MTKLYVPGTRAARREEAYQVRNAALSSAGNDLVARRAARRAYSVWLAANKPDPNAPTKNPQPKQQADCSPEFWALVVQTRALRKARRDAKNLIREMAQAT